MDVSNILNDLNDAQRQAVTSESKKLLVLAGAGSGKTKVLVHRIAWLIEALSNSTHSILAVTFTNKAASEMTGRIESILNQPIPEMWCGTFHSISNKLLRRHYAEAGLEKDFSILDSDDQLRVIKRILKEPDYSLIKQYIALLKTENVDLEFSDDGINAIANIASEVNSTVENIGARRLHTIIEKILDEISFTATDRSGVYRYHLKFLLKKFYKCRVGSKKSESRGVGWLIEPRSALGGACRSPHACTPLGHLADTG